MSSTTAMPTGPLSFISAGAWSVSVLVVTAVHHAYGAVIYQTPWRNHVLFLAVPAALLILALLYIAWTQRHSRLGTLAASIAAIVILLIPVAAIGVYEGGYNHLVKNVAFLIGGESGARVMFPPPTYEMPDDVFFEVTGIAQFPLAVLAAIHAFRLFKGGRA